MIMDNYDEIIGHMKPRHEIKASPRLRMRTEALLAKRRRRDASRRWLWWIGTSVIAAAVMGVLFIPFGMSAKEVLSVALDALRGDTSVEMTVEVRTSPAENFSYIDIGDDFVPHRIISTHFDSVSSWSIDKGGRAAVGIGSQIYCWLKDLKLGWTGYTSPHSVFEGLEIFISPGTILEAELRQCEAENGAEYTVEKKDGEIHLTVKAEPQGDFANPYLLDSSIKDSKNIRHYVLDAATKLLKSASVSIISDGREIEVLRVSGIKYGNGATVAPPPADVSFVDVASPSGAFAGLGPEDAAKKILGAFEKWDTSVIYKVIDPELAERSYRDIYEGAVLLKVGEAFRSGEFPGAFVPYVLRIRDGHVKEWNVALRRSADGGWEVDGGI